ncbi:hypothetical protein [uncultured Coprobacter sp.]|uniref:hypothetical protein n=1 Tax=uncultured Coprobacter sp. TaxID=1720550 RepID=UPI0025928980|nr:hypothetical protein [uncultured Coprobacter sp.]
METFYLGIVIFLFILAIFDLVVGVSNDAVNFLNSAIGAKAAPFKAIMCIAAIGIFIGASFSAIKGVNQAFARFTPFFTPKNVNLHLIISCLRFYEIL